MSNQLQADVLVIGAGTAGCYFAWQLGKVGYKVHILECKTLTNLGKNIEIFHMDKIRFDEFGIPHPTNDELIHEEPGGYNWSPDLKTMHHVHYPFYVMHMPSFIQRVQTYAREAGATILEHAKVNGVIIENGTLKGVTVEMDGGVFEARSRLVVDASGLAAAVRTRLPIEFGVENQPVPAKNCFFVCLEFRDEIPTSYPTGSNSYLFHKAFWNKSYQEGVILGIGQPHSFDYAWAKHKEWREEYFGDPGRKLYTRQGVIPYYRPPFSLVGNGFMVIGDAANQNKPFSGEGVTSGFTACKIASEVAIEALRKGDVSQAALWPYNVRYFRGQGAKFAGGLVQLPAVAELTRKDVNYLFRRHIIFSRADFEEMNRDYEIKMGTMKLIKVALGLFWGVIIGKFSANSLKKFIEISGRAGKLKAHYLLYPESPTAFPEWMAAARELWSEQD